MNKSILIAFTLITIAYVQSVSAQDKSFIEQQLPLQDEPVRNSEKATALYTRCIAQSYYRFNISTSNYIFTDSSKYTYSGNRGGAADSTLNFNEQIFMRPINSGVSNIYRYVCTYTATNKIEINEYQLWDTAQNNWKSTTRYKYTYNSADFRIVDSSYTWDTLNKAWAITGYTTYTRTATGKASVTNSLTWNKVTSQFDTTAQSLSNFDGADNHKEYTTRTATAGVLKNSTRMVYDYNSSNFCTLIISQKWNVNKWDNAFKYMYTPNAANKREGQLDLVWNAGKNDWDTAGGYVYTYDAGNNIIKNIYQQYKPSTSSFENVDEGVYTFNNNNQKTSTTTRTWNIGGYWETTTSDIKRFYYYETYDPATIAKLAVQGGELKVWPVPANNTLNIQLNWTEKQAYTAVIVDVQGRIHQQWQQPAVTTAIESINITNLPSGLYTILIQGNKGGLQKSTFTVVK